MARDGKADPTFIPAGFDYTVVSAVSATPDGGVLTSGSFESFPSPSRVVVKWLSDGRLDPDFFFDPQNVLAQREVLPDGRFVGTGYFPNAAAGSGWSVARFLANGSLDPTFHSELSHDQTSINALALDLHGDGFIVVGGEFREEGGQRRNHLVRLHSDGSLDSDFSGAVTLPYTPTRILVLSDRRVLVAVIDPNASSSGFHGVLRLNVDGSLDSTFHSRLDSTASPTRMVEQPDGKILLCGVVPVNGLNSGVVRLLKDGTVDATFAPGSGNANSAQASVWSLLLESNGSVLVGGSFEVFNGVPANGLIRLKSTGAVDPTFDPGAFRPAPLHDDLFPVVSALDRGPGGTVYVGGDFDRVGLTPRLGIARLLDSGSESTPYSGRFAFSAPTYSVSETGKVAHVTISRLRSTAGEATISVVATNIARSGETGFPATPGLDFVETHSVLTFADGQKTATFDIPILADDQVEETESVLLQIESTSDNAAVGAPSTAILSILENLVSIEIVNTPESSGVYSFAESTSTAFLRLQRRGNHAVTTSVRFTTVDGTAMAGQDYTATSVLLRFSPDQESLLLPISIREDALMEGTEFFQVVVTNTLPEGVRITPRQWTVAIEDNDDLGPGSVGPDGGGLSAFLQARFQTVEQLISTPDGGFVVVGRFINDSSFTLVVRGFNSDGSLKPGFGSGLPTLISVDALASGPDGSVVVGGRWISPDDPTQPGGMLGLLRLTAEGFAAASHAETVITGYSITAVAVDSQNRTVVGGLFSEVGGVECHGLARLDSQGEVDASFHPDLHPITPGESVEVITIDTDTEGGLLVLGSFGNVETVKLPGLVRLSPDGKVNSAFDPQRSLSSRPYSVALQKDGKVLVLSLDRAEILLRRLNLDGSIDTAFEPSRFSLLGQTQATGRVRLLPDGSVVCVGDFDQVNGVTRRSLAHFHPNGQLDYAVDPGQTVRLLQRSLWDVEKAGTVLLSSPYGAPGTPEQLVQRIAFSTPGFLGRLEFAQMRLQVWKTQEVAFIKILRSGATVTQPASVNVFAESETATNGADFQFPIQSILFNPGELEKTVRLTLTQTNDPAPPKRLRLHLSLNVGAILGSAAFCEVTIVDHPGGVLDPEQPWQLAPGELVTFPVSLPGEGWAALGFFYEAGQPLTVRGAFFNPDGSRDLDPPPRFPDDIGHLFVDPIGNVYVRSQAFGILMRLDRTGTPDSSFDANAKMSEGDLLLLPDGRIWSHTRTMNSEPGSGTVTYSEDLQRLLANGQPDTTAQLLRLESDGQRLPKIQKMLRWADGSVLVGGSFEKANGEKHRELMRLLPDGKLDPDFLPNLDGEVGALCATPEGRIMVGGTIYSTNGLPSARLVRLRIDGTVDPSFQIALPGFTGVKDLAIQGDGKILVSVSNNDVSNQLIRLLSSGAPDPTFDPFYAPNNLPLILQSDGRVVAGNTRLLNDAGVAAGRLEFVESLLELGESAGHRSTVVHVRRVGGSRGTVLATVGSFLETSTLAADLTFSPSVIRFEDGEAGEKTIQVEVVDDVLPEGDETHLLHLSFPVGGATVGRPLPIHVLDDDTVVQFSSTLRVVAGEGMPAQRIELHRDGDLHRASTVRIATEDLSSDPVRDYRLSESVVVFPAGAADTSFTLTALVDQEPEADEELILHLTDPSDGMILGEHRSLSVTLGDHNRSGTIDPAFQLDLRLTNASSFVQYPIGATALLQQPDGRILVSGAFRPSANFSSVGIVRLQPDGSLDGSFTPGGSDSGVTVVPYGGALGLQRSGRVLVMRILVQSYGTLVRLESDGRLDPNFHVDLKYSSGFPLISAFAVLPDDRILVAGLFDTINGVERHGLARLSADGVVDPEFDPGAGPQSICCNGFSRLAFVNAIALQPDGKAVLGGSFSHWDKRERSALARLETQGHLDETFAPHFGFGEIKAVPPYITVIRVDADERLVVGGFFNEVNGYQRPGLARLSARGEVDPLFQVADGTACGEAASPIPPAVVALELDALRRMVVVRQPAGRLLCPLLERLKADGSPDRGFANPFRDLAQDRYVSLPVPQCLAALPDGSWLVGGSFDRYEDASFRGLVWVHGGVDRFEFDLWPGSFESLANGNREIRFAMPQGKRYRIEASGDLEHWEPLEGGRIFLNESRAKDAVTQAPRRFYRAIRDR